jgi:hypothetical protein
MKLLFLLLFFPAFCFAQKSKNVDAYRDRIDNNIYRVVATQYAPGYLYSLSFQYEKIIKKSLTLLAQMGTGIDVQHFGNIDSHLKYAFSAFGSVESRYYFNLAHRIKKEKAVHNFSAFYLSLQEFILSNPFIFVNQTAGNSTQGNIQTFFNLGWQKQYQSLYLHVYGGPSLFKKSFSKYENNKYLDEWQMGFAIGLVL